MFYSHYGFSFRRTQQCGNIRSIEKERMYWQSFRRTQQCGNYNPKNKFITLVERFRRTQQCGNIHQYTSSLLPTPRFRRTQQCGNRLATSINLTILSQFQKNLVVWKLSPSCTATKKSWMVSEELSSVETTFMWINTIDKLYTRFRRTQQCGNYVYVDKYN